MANEGDGDVEIATHSLKLTPTYDVFLCFRGADTRHSFTRNLYKSLSKKKIKTFMDEYGLKRGEDISSIIKALEESRIAIVVFSKDFASSSFCLDQLVKIVENQDKRNQQVLPIFYDVDPSDVRCESESDKGSYKPALAKLQQQRCPDNPEKIENWISALSRLASTTTSYEEWQLHNRKNYEFEYEYERIDKIVEWVTSTVHRSNVFLSFLGRDTRYSFVHLLQDALEKESFKIHMHDEESEDMDQISLSIVRAIDKSYYSIIVLSENYAYSSHCLDELVMILDCMEMKNQQVCPIFYKVEPSDVRHQKNSFKSAMVKHETEFGRDYEKVHRWGSALREVTNLSGYFIRIGEEQELDHIISSIVKQISYISIGEKGDRFFTEEHQEKPGQDHVSISEISDSSLTEEHQQKGWRYDVFISFQGKDTRESFTGYLYHALLNEGFKAFMDNEALEKDDIVMDTIRKAIEDSRIFIVVLSENYASSFYCLEELTLILDCKKRNYHHLVYAIYYGVDQSDVKKLRGSYDMAALGEKCGKMEVEKWTSAVREAADLPGYIIELGMEQEPDHIIRSIVKQISDVFISEKGDRSHQQKRRQYDVFISFRGRDTRESFTGYLYHALHHEGYKAFMDDEALEKDDIIMDTIREAIENSRIFIVVLSENYASSVYCLKELTLILDCKKRNDHQLVYPVYYGVDQSDVKEPRGRYDMAALGEKYGNVEVEKWSSTMREVADLSGYTIELGDEDQHDHHIQTIVEWASKHLASYDVFLSFSGKDCCSYADFLLTALNMKGFKTFTSDKGSEDDGDQSSKSDFTENIEKSRLSIIIFSENYIHSSSCLNELVTIISSMKVKRQLVWPIFYKVEPSDVRHPTYSFEKAMIEHENKFGHDKVQEWKLAMSEAASLSGWHLKTGNEYESIEEIVKRAIEI